jgi:hypothetical protein
VEDYNTPPLQGLDGEIYEPGTLDHHAAMTELLLHGFNCRKKPVKLIRSGLYCTVSIAALTRVHILQID